MLGVRTGAGTMGAVAVKMLLGDRRRYHIIVFGIALSAFLMSHQLSVFDGAIDRTTSLIQDAHPKDGIWVIDPHVLNMDDAEYVPSHALLRVRSCEGGAGQRRVTNPRPWFASPRALTGGRF